MKRFSKIITFTLLVFSLIRFQGCLESNTIPEVILSPENSVEMLSYFETHGDFINSMDAPPVVEAIDVYNNLSRYLVLDVRAMRVYRDGHISSAQNVKSKDLIEVMKKESTKNYERVLIVSASGQESAYYATLLRLLDYNNVYTLNFGMAAWNKSFAEPWFAGLGDLGPEIKLTNEVFERHEITYLPRLIIKTKSNKIKDKIEERVKLLLEQGFSDDLSFQDQIMNKASGHGSSGGNTPAIITGKLKGPVIDKDTFFGSRPPNSYLICYGNDNLYVTFGLFDPFNGKGHPLNAILYAQAMHLKTSYFLQTLPTDQTIYIYCYNGQLSACVTAYLRVLGYDARSILYGANALFYSRMVFDIDLRKYAFTEDRIYDLP